MAPPLYRTSFIVTDSVSRADCARAGLPPTVAIGEPGIDARFAPDPAVGRSPEPLIVSVGRLVSTKGRLSGARVRTATPPGW
ncbi:MAG: hypothetical protein R2726_16365 [Acidimicrobiales bacterium]